MSWLHAPDGTRMVAVAAFMAARADLPAARADPRPRVRAAAAQSAAASRRNSSSLTRPRFSAPSCFTRASSSARLLLGNVEAELGALDPDRVEAGLLAEHERAVGADEVGRVRLDRRRVVELRRDGARLAAEERLADERLPRLELVARQLAHARETPRARGRAAGSCSTPYSAPSASATSGRLALPARSPMPLIVPWIHVAPACTAATAAAVARPKSLWPCQWIGTSTQLATARRRGTRPPRASRRRACRRRRPRARPPRPRSCTTRSRKLEVGARPVHAEVRDGDVVLGGERDGLADALEHHRRGSTPYAFSFRSETGASITEWRRPSSTSASTSACTAREKPQISAFSPASGDQARSRCASSADTRGKPASIRSMPSSSSRRAISSFCSGSSATPTACSPSRSVVSYRPTCPRGCALERARVQIAEVELVRAGSRAHDPVGEAAQLLGCAVGDQPVVLDAQAAAALPVDARLDREHHALADRAGAGLVRVRRLVRARADAVRDRVRRLARVAGLGDAGPDQPVELGEVARRRGSARPRGRSTSRSCCSSST